MLQVHHLIPVSVDYDLQYDFDNLITLCRNCHFLFGHLKKWTSFNPFCTSDARTFSERIRSRP